MPTTRLKKAEILCNERHPNVSLSGKNVCRNWNSRVIFVSVCKIIFKWEKINETMHLQNTKEAVTRFHKHSLSNHFRGGNIWILLQISICLCVFLKKVQVSAVSVRGSSPVALEVISFLFYLARPWQGNKYCLTLRS